MNECVRVEHPFSVPYIVASKCELMEANIGQGCAGKDEMVAGNISAAFSSFGKREGVVESYKYRRTKRCVVWGEEEKEANDDKKRMGSLGALKMQRNLSLSSGASVRYNDGGSRGKHSGGG